MKREIPAHWINENQAMEPKPPGGLALFLHKDNRWGVGQGLDAVLVLLLYISIIIFDSLWIAVGLIIFHHILQQLIYPIPKPRRKSLQSIYSLPTLAIIKRHEGEGVVMGIPPLTPLLISPLSLLFVTHFPFLCSFTRGFSVCRLKGKHLGSTQ